MSVSQEILFTRGRALQHISDWRSAQKALKDGETLVGLFTEDGCDYVCPLITCERDFLTHLARCAPRVIAEVGMGRVVNESQASEGLFLLAVKPIFYALACGINHA